MILTNCAACAAPLAHDAPQCIACQTRYCSDRCERYDRRRGGHGKICGAIASGGGAEPYHAEKKYEEAVADAVEECADDTEGQTCYICLEDGSEEGLVRGCACRGASGIAHVSCLTEQARRLVADAEERDLDDMKWERWYTCGLCEQHYYGVVYCALGWGCWKTYVGRPEADQLRGWAMTELGNGLNDAYYLEDELRVREATLSMMRRIGADEESMLVPRTNLAGCLHELGRDAESLSMKREIFADALRIHGKHHEDTITDAGNLARSLIDDDLFQEARSLVRDYISAARRTVGDHHYLTLDLRRLYARAISRDTNSSLGDLHEAVTILEDVVRTTRRVFGLSHPYFILFCEDLECVRMRQADDESRGACAADAS